MEAQVTNFNPADLRDRWGRVTPDSLVAGDYKTKTFGTSSVTIQWSYTESKYVVVTRIDGVDETFRTSSIRSARSHFSSECRYLLSKQHQPETNETV